MRRYPALSSLRASLFALLTALLAIGLWSASAYAQCSNRGDLDSMFCDDDLDLVVTATPWEWHVPVCVAAMRNGKHAATEVPAASTANLTETQRWAVNNGEKNRL